MSEQQVAEFAEVTKRAKYILTQATVEAHEVGRSRGYRQALADANEGIGLWKEKYPQGDLLSYTVARRHMEAKYAERIHPPEGPEEPGQEWVAPMPVATFNAALDQAKALGHREGAQAEHDKTHEEAMVAVKAWIDGDTSLNTLVPYIAAHLRESYQARTKPPPKDWSHPEFPAAVKEAATSAFDETMKEARQEAAKAEHEATLADMDALYRAWERTWQMGDPNYLGVSFKRVRDGMDAKYEARTNPQPVIVTVTMKMPQSSYDTINWEYWKAELLMDKVDPPGETEKSEEK